MPLKVVSPSLGSRRRDHEVTISLDGQECHVSRVGTDGDFEYLKQLYRDLDGEVDAIGMGGIDLYLFARGKRYTIRDAKRLRDEAPNTPTVDGSGLKNTLERQAVEGMAEEGLDLADKRVLMVSAVDRFGMAEALHDAGADITFGDLIFGLGIPIPIRSWRTFNFLAAVLLPIVTKLPFQLIYPTGADQDEAPKPGRARYYEEADVVAGDFLYVRKYMPADMSGKWVITNTTTAEDVEELTRRGVEVLVTTTPVLEGRSFGTNVMEALLVALAHSQEEGDGQPAARPRSAEDGLAPDEYLGALERFGLKPTVRRLGQGA